MFVFSVFFYIIKNLKTIILNFLYLILVIIYNLILLFINTFFFFLFLLGIFIAYAINSSIFCIFFLYIYLYLISPIIYVSFFYFGTFIKFWPFLFIYFIMCYNTIYIPGYKTFYFFRQSLWYWKLYFAYYVKIYFLNFYFIYYFNLIFSLLIFYYFFFDFNFLIFIFLIYINHIIYYYTFLFFKFIGNISSLILLLIINIFYIKNLMILSILNTDNLSIEDSIWEVFNHRLNYRLSNFDYENSRIYSKVNKLFLRFNEKKDKNLEMKVIDTYTDWYKIKDSKLDFFNMGRAGSYWVRHKEILDIINLEISEEKKDIKFWLDKIKEYDDIYSKDIEYHHYMDGEIVSTEPYYNQDISYLNLDSKINDLNYYSFKLYRKLLQKEMGTDIFYLPTLKDRNSLYYTMKNPIYRYIIYDYIIDLKTEDDYIERETKYLEKIYWDDKNFKKGNYNFFDILKYNFSWKNSKIEDYKDLYFNINKETHLDNFFKNYLKSRLSLHKGDFYAYNENFIYNSIENYIETDDIEELLNNPYFDMDDIKAREDFSLKRLYYTVKYQTLYNVDDINFKKLKYKDFNDVLLNRKILEDLNSKWFEDHENIDFLSLESAKNKFDPSLSRHIFRKNKNYNFKYSIYDLKSMEKHENYSGYFG